VDERHAMSPTHPRGPKQGAVGAAEALEAIQAVWMKLGSRLMVQVVCLTINDRQVVCIAPVLHAPDLGICAGDIQAIEFGELMPAFLAAKLLQESSPDNEDLH